MTATPPVRIPVEGEPSYLSVPHASGYQLFEHVTVTRGGALDVITMTVGPEGIRDVTRAETSRKKLRGDLDEIARAGVRVVPAPADYVAWRMRQAVRDAAAEGRRAPPLRAEQALAKVPEVAVEPRHPALTLSPVRDAERRVQASFELHQEPEVMAWLPSVKALEAFTRHVDRYQQELTAGQMASASEHERGERVQRVVHEAIDEFYTPSERSRLATDLRDAAVLFAATRRPERALDAVATADAIETSGMFTTPTHTIPFVYTLFYKYLMVLDRKRQQAEARGAG